MSYRKENITKILNPDNFLAPPTSSIGHELKYLAQNFQDALSEQKRFLFFRGTTDKVLLGAEFEIIFFAKGFDYKTRSPRRIKTNPNYKESHIRKVKSAKELLNVLTREEEIFERPDNNIGNLSIEFRTSPLGLNEYFSAVEKFREQVVSICRKKKLVPVPVSQHLHVSVMSGFNNRYKEVLDRDRRSFLRRINWMFRSVSPLVLLPSEHCCTPAHVDAANLSRHSVPERAEFRLLSSEFACDPVLNACLCLCSLRDAMLMQNLDEVVPGWSHDYASAIQGMRANTRLTELFGASVIHSLAGIVQYYPQVEQRSIALTEVIH